MYEMEDHRTTTELAKSVRDNNLLCKEIIKRSMAKLKEYRTLSRIAS